MALDPDGLSCGPYRSRTSSPAEVTEATEITQRSGEAEHERSAECGRARNAGPADDRNGASTNPHSTDLEAAVCARAVSAVRVTAGFASRRPHEFPALLVLRFSASPVKPFPPSTPFDCELRG